VPPRAIEIDKTQSARTLSPAGTAVRDLTGYFWPLALQAAAQSVSYPLVAIVASQGKGGPLNLAGLSQSNAMMFLLGTLGAGLITTGMMYGQTREGFRRFAKVNLIIALATVALQGLLSIPVAAHWLFGSLIKLPPAIERPASTTLAASLVMQFLFFMRNPYQVVLYINKATIRASSATIGRIVLTLMLAPVFCWLGWVGPVWAVVCQTIPVALEAFVSRRFALPFLRGQDQADGSVPRHREIFFFNVPLSIGGFFLSLSGIVVGAIIARAPDPENMLPVYYLAAGLAGPMAFAATRLQAVVIAFFSMEDKQRVLLIFSLAAGTVLGIIPLLFCVPGPSYFYYVKLQNLDPALLRLVRLTAVALAIYPVAVALRAYSEGLAAARRRPITILAGQSAFLGALAIASLICLALGMPGNYIGPSALIIANLVTAAIIQLSLQWEREQPGKLPEGMSQTIADL
jgi:hypothetical protein